MGMYTEIRTDFTLRPDTPEQVIKTLMVMAGLDSNVSFNDREKFDHGQDHELFKTDRWGIMLTMGSAYFDDEPNAVVTRTRAGPHFTSVSNFKNYDGEIRKFADWIRPYIFSQDTPYVTSVYEETTDVATRYFTDGHIDTFDMCEGEVLQVLRRA
ncbi:hypothetical protein [Myxococcus phage Mx1]|nr:hypothetical protein [Myxococcus phage Mx1]